MSSLRLALSQLETRLQDLIEGSAERLFPSEAAPRGIIRPLLQAMQEGVHIGVDGKPIAPNLYVLLTNPEDAIQLTQNELFLDELARLLRQACLEANLGLSGPLSLRIEPYSQLLLGEIRVVARDSARDVTPTAGMLLLPADNDQGFPNAYLIVDGVHLFQLEQPVINIGRRPDNQLVIDDPRISRLHAQLRFVRGRFMIFDLESTGGTFVNGRQIHQHALAPGDVISLAGLPLVFGQDSGMIGDTQQLTVDES